MKKKLFCLLVIAIHFQNAYSQAGLWTWISGSNIPNVGGIYGIQGVPSVNNHPPAVYEACEWKDKQGNFWVYSGYSNFDDDLWKFNPLTLEWTWVKGSGLSGQNPVYGSQGVSDPANSPGQRYFGAGTWVDTTGNLWLFGGLPYRNDLWRYDIGTNEWTWMKGDTTVNSFGSHGTQGIPDPSNTPGSRYESASQWTDSLNNLWLFGGDGYGDFGTTGFLNDLMKYDISTNEWTWMKGSNLTNAATNYGIKEISSPLNDPGGRWTYTKYKDSNGFFWLGSGSQGGILNDMWRYNIGNNEWTWMAGTSTMGDPGVFISYCNTDSISNPGSRAEQRSSVTDRCGRFWTFGGRSSTSNPFSDLWVFDPDVLQWKWIAGPSTASQNGSFGSLGVSSASNLPPSHIGGLAWWGDDDRFYLYGGWNCNTAFYSDMWVFTPDSSCTISCGSIPVAAFTAPNHVCPGTCTDFINLSTGANSYLWFFPGSSTSVSTDFSPQNICYNLPGSYDVTLIVTNSLGSDTLTLLNYINVYPYPAPQGINQSGDTLFALAGAPSYQWYFNGNIISGATDYYYVAQSSGDYNVVATDENGCEVEAAVFNVIADVLSTVDRGLWTVFPNPVGDKVIIQKSEVKSGTAPQGVLRTIEISIYNVLGEKISLAIDSRPDSYRELTVDCRLLSPGLYYIEITSSGKTYRSKFVKQ
ncbi:MAG: T9SS type A sorting domain-containing protein [Bacteroidetes bacterium]|nr:T9SS type A sorting domain-containing protein [Bacteroidota bacterium]